jgi:DNA (cytosine-5)-methyltransferase 1
MLRVLDLFSAAAGGWSLGMHRAGFTTVAACEVINWRRALYAQNNPGVVIYDDVRTLSADRLVSDLGYLPSVIVGSPPCQDISSANTKGKGVEGERSGLYFEAIRIIGEVRPRWFALENSANLRTRGADRVLTALEAIGYSCWPFVVSAGDIGANHPRKRSWLIGFNARDAEKNRWGTWRTRGRPVAVAGLPIEACRDAYTKSVRCDSWSGDNQGIEQKHDWCVPGNDNGYGREIVLGDSNGARRAPFRKGNGEVGGCEGTCATLAEPWSDWNSGLAHHLRVDDGLSGWVAQSRIAVGGPRGTSAASLIVEAFGDSVLPQIPEAIGRAILRTEAALSAIYWRAA